MAPIADYYTEYPQVRLPDVSTLIDGVDDQPRGGPAIVRRTEYTDVYVDLAAL
jgi:hypothetical protein